MGAWKVRPLKRLEKGSFRSIKSWAGMADALDKAHRSASSAGLEAGKHHADVGGAKLFDFGS
jgi:hypothetical protein